MRAAVMFDEREVGKIDWEPDAYGVQVTVDCAQPCDPLTLLRCYGLTAGEPLLIGLPEPKAGRLTLTRHLSREMLKTAGCMELPPSGFYLSDGCSPIAVPLPTTESKQENSLPESETTPEPSRSEEPEHIRTGDTILDSLINLSAVQTTQNSGEIILRCAFASDQPFALAPVFVLAKVTDGQAVVQIKKEDTV